MITRYVLELWLPFAVAVALALAVPTIGRVGVAAVVALAATGIALSTWNAATPAARRVNWDTVAAALGPTSAKRVVVGPGYLVSVGLSLYLPDAHLASCDERIVTRNLVLISLRPVPDYAIGPCFWGADCGGKGIGAPRPRSRPRARSGWIGSGSTPRVNYNVFRSKRPARVPSPHHRAGRDRAGAWLALQGRSARVPRPPLEERAALVLAEDVAHRAAHLADRGARAQRVLDRVQQVALALGDLAKLLEPGVDRPWSRSALNSRQPLDLAPLGLRVDPAGSRRRRPAR